MPRTICIGVLLTGSKRFLLAAESGRECLAVRDPSRRLWNDAFSKHRNQNVFLVADAYRGIQIKQAIADFLDAAAGIRPEQVAVQAGPKTSSIVVAGGANLVVYVGHEGFMDFQLPALPASKNASPRPAIVLACISKSYFAAALRTAGAQPLVWTTGLMAPEAYILKSALDGWMLNESNEQIRERAAVAYNQYQKCGLNAARRLLVTGW